MSWFFGAKKEASKEKDKIDLENLKALGVDPSLFEDPKLDDDEADDVKHHVVDEKMLADASRIANEELDDDVDLDEADLNDPALLAELAEAGWESDGDGRTHSKAPSQAPIAARPKQLPSLSKGKADPKDGHDDLDEDVQLNEKDLQDPQLLADLKESGWESVGDSKGPVAPGVSRAAALEAQIQQAKQQALTLKRSGDQAGAVEALKTIKRLHADLDQLQNSTGAIQVPTRAKVATTADGPPPLPPRKGPTVELCQSMGSLAIDDSLKPDTSTKPSAPTPTKPASTPTTTTPVPPSRPQGSTPSKPNQPIGTPGAVSRATSAEASAKAAAAARKAEEDRLKFLGLLRDQLTAQIESLTEQAKSCLRANKKEAAAALVQEKKRASGDLELIKAALSDSSVPLPKYHSEVRSIRKEIRHDDLTESEMEVSVLSYTPLAIEKSADSLSLQITVPYPSAESPTVNHIHNLDKAVIVDGSATLSSHFKLNIDRKVSALKRAAQNRRIDFELRRTSSALFGLLGGKTSSIGRASLPLKDLLTQAGIASTLDVVGESRRHPPAKISVRVRIRDPIVQARDIRDVKETYVFLDRSSLQPQPAPAPSTPTPTSRGHPPATGTPSSSLGPSSRSVAPATPSSSSQPARPVTSPSATSGRPAAAVTSPSATSSSGRPSAPVTSPAPLSQTPAKRPIAAPQELVEDEDDDPDGIENIESASILEAEVNKVTEQIQQYKARGAVPPDDLVSRKDEAAIKLQILQVQVESGQLTPELYAKKLQDSINWNKKLALKMKKRGDPKAMEYARNALLRIKMMQEEMQEWEQNSAQA